MIFDPEVLTKHRLAYLKLRAISGSSRFYVLNIVRANGRISVSEIVQKSGIEQPIVSQHLSVLKKAGFVIAEKQKKEVFYQINHIEIDKMIRFSRKITNLPQHESNNLNDNYPEILKAYQNLKYLISRERIILLEFIEKKQEISVGALVELSSQSQSMVSQNLGILRNLHFVSFKQDGKSSIYFLNREEINRYKKALEQEI